MDGSTYFSCGPTLAVPSPLQLSTDPPPQGNAVLNRVWKLNLVQASFSIPFIFWDACFERLLLQMKGVACSWKEKKKKSNERTWKCCSNKFSVFSQTHCPYIVWGIPPLHSRPPPQYPPMSVWNLRGTWLAQCKNICNRARLLIVRSGKAKLELPNMHVLSPSPSPSLIYKWLFTLKRHFKCGESN